MNDNKFPQSCLKRPLRKNINFFFHLVFLFILNFGLSVLLKGQTSPYIQQGNKLVSTLKLMNQAHSVAISGDGNTIILAANTFIEGQGIVFSYSRINNRWVEGPVFQTINGMLDPENMNCLLDISADGNTAIISWLGDNGNMGSAWIFYKKDEIWLQTGIKLSNNLPLSNFGSSVSISSDGMTALVGGRDDNNSIGGAWVFSRKGDNWFKQAKLVGDNFLQYPYQGCSVSLSADGNTAAIGGFIDNEFDGAAWVFTRNDTSWRQQGNKFTSGATVGSKTRFGGSVKLSADGNALVVGAERDNISQGATWIFYRTRNLWDVQGTKIIGTKSGMGSSQGHSLAISPDGQELFSSGFYDNNGLGAVWPFQKISNSWNQNGEKIIGSGSSVINKSFVFQGTSISLGSNTLVSGGSVDNEITGAAWIFQKMPLFSLTPSSYESLPKASVDASFTLKNVEPSASPNSYINYFLSNDKIYDSTDILLSKNVVYVPSIPGSGTVNVTAAITAPATPGKYFVLAVVDANNVSYQYNSLNLIGNIPLTVGNADLYFAKDSILKNPVRPGDSLQVASTLGNKGATSVNAANVTYYFSTDAKYDATDISIGTNNTGLIATGNSTVLPVQRYQIPAGMASGTYYVISIADPSNAVVESDETNNTGVVSFQVAAPLMADLSIASASALPANPLPGDVISFSCTLWNKGNTSTPPSSLAYVYSKDTLYDINDMSIGAAVPIGSIPAGGSVPINPQTYQIPANTIAGNYYILFIADQTKTVTESNENNNVAIASLSVGAFSDLQAAIPSIPKTTLLPGESTVISGSVNNLGASAASEFQVQYYFSSDALYDPADLPINTATAITGLAAQGSVNLTAQNFQIPATTTSGTWYILCLADVSGVLKESNKINNLSVLSVKIGTFSDLVPTAPNLSRISLIPGDTLKVSCSVANTGGSAAAAFDVQYFISKDAVFDATDTPILDAYSFVSLPAGGTGKVPFQTLTLPATVGAGSWYLICYADKAGVVKESDENNNVAFTPFAVSALPDLQVSLAASPVVLLPGESSDITATVSNNGISGATAFSVQYYLSADAVYNNGDTPLFDPISLPALDAGKHIVLPSKKYQVQANATSSALFILCIVDPGNTIKESMEDNNTALVTLKVGSFADLYVVNQLANPSNILAGDSTAVSCSVVNLGTSSTSSGFNLQYFLSTNNTYESTDIALSDAMPEIALASTAVLDVPKSIVRIPQSTIPGNYFILVYADKENALKEQNKINNVGAIPITLIGLPDFIITKSVLVPSTVYASDSLSIASTLVNNGGKSINSFIGIQYFLSQDQKYDQSVDVPLSPVLLQNTPGSLSSADITPKKFLIPTSITPGNYYVIIVADEKNSEKESNDNNNTTSVALSVTSLPDLSIFSLKNNIATNLPGDSLYLSAILSNYGSSTGGGFNVQYFFSSDQILDGKDVEITGIISLPAITGTAQLALPPVSYKVPLNATTGTYYVLLAVDSKNIVRESNETNNLGMTIISISYPELADLALQNALLDRSSATAGDSIGIACQIRNAGTAAPSLESKLQYYLSSDALLDINDIALGNSFSIPRLLPGITDSIPTRLFQLPVSLKAGKYYILLQADKDHLLSEVNESNNTATLQIRIVEQCDLSVLNAKVNSVVLFPGDTCMVSCTVSNKGIGGSQLSVGLQYYLSRNENYDSFDIPLGAGIPVPTLAAGTQVEIPSMPLIIPDSVGGGDYFILLFADNGRLVSEVNESNNVAAVPVKVQTFPDLSIQNFMAGGQKVFPGDSLEFSTTIQNYGKGKTESTFRIQYFLSKNQVFDASDLAISGLIGAPVLQGGLSKATTFTYKFPITTLAGTYYVLVVADVAKQVREENENNNIGKVAIQIGNTELTDLSIDKLFADLSVVVAGDTVQLDCTVLNSGKADAAVSKTQYFISTDKELSSDDLPLSDPISAGALKSQGSIAIPAKKYRIPVRLSPNIYYILAVADVENLINEANEINNTDFRQLRIEPFPDLKIIKVHTSTNSLFIGDSTIISSYLFNSSGSNMKVPSSLQYFFSSDQVYDAQDTPISKSISIRALKVLDKDTIGPVKVHIPDNILGGFYYILAYADNNKKILESDESNNVSSLLFIVKPRPVIIPPGTKPDNSKLKVNIEVKVKSELPVASVRFTYRKIADTIQVISEELPLGGLSYNGGIPKNFIDEIGVEYTFLAIDSSGNQSLLSKGSIPVTWENSGLRIPYTSYGKTAANYRIISVPLILKQSHIDSVFYKTLGHYEKNKWRVFNYQGETNIEYTNGLKNLIAGNGFWFIAKDSGQSSLFTGSGATVDATSDNPFSISLQKGWNQIGNPYNMEIFWSDIKNYKKNEFSKLGNLKKWEGKWEGSDVIGKMEGGFVLASAPTTLYFPTQKRKKGTFRIASPIKVFNDQNWEVPLHLSEDGQEYTMGGLGMNIQANKSLDSFDDVTPPRFIDYLEINFHHPEYFYEKFTKDIVPASSNYIWEFSAESSHLGAKTLSWKNEELKNNSKKLMLYDKEEEKAIDMANGNSYTFEASRKKNFQVYYGGADFLKENLNPEKITLGNPYPNPFNERTSLSMSISATDGPCLVELSIYNSLGEKIQVLNNSNYTTGFYEFSWNGLNYAGEKQPAGVYICKMNVFSKNIQKILSRKLMLR